MQIAGSRGGWSVQADVQFQSHYCCAGAADDTATDEGVQLSAVGLQGEQADVVIVSLWCAATPRQLGFLKQPPISVLSTAAATNAEKAKLPARNFFTAHIHAHFAKLPVRLHAAPHLRFALLSTLGGMVLTAHHTHSSSTAMHGCLPPAKRVS
jgi:hypothetical protein